MNTSLWSGILPNYYSRPPVDAVYLWVDGGGSRRSKQRAIYRNLGNAPALVDCCKTYQFRDNGELRYSLRSLEAFAPWIAKVHIVTDGQVPCWIDPSHPKLNLVNHRTIFRDDNHLPTFNSNAIELNLHRIPHLSRKFLYLNDDTFLGSEAPFRTFVGADGRQRFFLEQTELHDSPAAGPTHDRAYAYTQMVADQLWGRSRPRLLPAHAPQLYDRKALQSIERIIPEEFARTSGHRFRSPDDLVLRVLYSCWLLEGSPQPERGEAVTLDDESPLYYFYRHRGSMLDWGRNLMAIRRLRPRFFCINDELGDSFVDRLKARSIGAALCALFPKPSTFERRR